MKISTILEPVRLARVAMENSGMTIMIWGKLMAVMKPLRTTLLPRKTKRPST